VGDHGCHGNLDSTHINPYMARNIEDHRGILPAWVTLKRCIPDWSLLFLVKLASVAWDVAMDPYLLNLT
jgi:hypothetical protein